MKHIILIILLTLGVWAQEIGVPYVDIREVVAQSATLSPDGKAFYTYANNTLTHWNLNPVKVLDSVKIESGSYRLLTITSNKKGAIFSKIGGGISLYDLENGQLIQTQGMKLRDADLFGSLIITVDLDRTITQWDSQNLKIVKRIQLPFFKSDDGSHDIPLGMIKSKNGKTFTLVTGNRLVVFNSESLDILKEIVSSFSHQGFVSSDCKEIIGNMINFDINSLQVLPSNEVTRQPNIYTYPLHRYRYYPQSGCLSFTTNTYFYKFNDENWLMITPDGHFDGSPESRKYLYMKTSSGKSVPIDDATYNKFHKKINLKD